MTLPDALINVLAGFALTYVIVMISVTALWLLSLKIGDASIIDMFWGAGFILLVIGLVWLHRPQSAYAWMLAAMPVLWALRYSVHIFRRNWGHGEDARYTKLRSWARSERRFAWISLTRIFLLQGHVMVLVASPVIVALSLGGPPAFAPLLYLGAAIWLCGVAIEAFADAQLARFRADPAKKGQILDTGLWRYSRHPNYFGDALLWWGIWVAACAQPWALTTVIGPIAITHFLINVTGMATLDKKLAREKPGYQAYIERTSGFIPRPPKPARD